MIKKTIRTMTLTAAMMLTVSAFALRNYKIRQ